MASKILILSIACILLAGAVRALPVNNNEEERAAVTTQESASVEEETPEDAIFNFEIPTEEELNPDGLDEEQKKLQELQPPAIDSYVPFAEPEEKPRKGGKKYNAGEKWINKKPVQPKASSGEQLEEQQNALLDFIIRNLIRELAPPGIRISGSVGDDAAKSAEEDWSTPLVLNKGEYLPNPQRRIDDFDNERVLFQVQGHQGGPKSYKFGFDTGKKDDRQFRVEEQDNDGTVRGQYGYVDKRGRAHVMNYTSSAEEGFRVVRVS